MDNPKDKTSKIFVMFLIHYCLVLVPLFWDYVRVVRGKKKKKSSER